MRPEIRTMRSCSFSCRTEGLPARVKAEEETTPIDDGAEVLWTPILYS